MARLLWQREMPGLRIAEERNVEIKSDMQTLQDLTGKNPVHLVSVFAWTSAGDLLNDLLKPRRARKSVGLP